MRLSDLLEYAGEGTLRRLTLVEDQDPEVSEVTLDDGVTALGEGQIVLAIRPGGEHELVDRCARAGCSAVVVAPDVQVDSKEIAVLEAKSAVGWTQLFVLIRTLLLASHDETASDGFDGAPTSVHGLADAIAVMVGGTVVLYDRAHRVVAYSVQGHAIDDVRRDTILGRRTPDQWIRRFTVDRTAYQTYTEPGKVVRVANYQDLRTRLRIAVHAGTEVIGEISVAEGNDPLPPHAEEALKRAARLAVPAMLSHRRASDVDEATRERLVRAVLRDGKLVSPEHPSTAAYVDPGNLVVIAFRLKDLSERDVADQTVVSERLVHFLSLHLKSLGPGAQVIYLDETYYAIVPDFEKRKSDLSKHLSLILSQLSRMKVSANAAIGEFVSAVRFLPRSRRRADNLLDVAQINDRDGVVVDSDSEWADLILLVARRSINESMAPCPPLDRLREFDASQNSEFVKTLQVYLENFGSMSAAAAELYLHVNTLRHRIQRISEISGLNIDDHSERLAAALLINMRQTPPSRERLSGEIQD